MATNTAGGVGLPTILTIVFVVLKLTSKIDWPWLWVLSPLWISFLLYAVMILLVVGVSAFLDRR